MCPRPARRARVRGATPRLRLLHDGLRIDVETHDRATLAWLLEFLGPTVRGGRPGGRPPDHLVRFVTGAPASSRRTARRADAGAPEVDVFTFDGEFSRLPVRRDATGRRWVRDPRSGGRVGVSADAASVWLVAPRALDRRRVLLLRVVRELLTTAQLRSGRLPLHAAAFLHAGRAVLVGGPKRAGKSSLLLHALAGGATFLSNDRLFVATRRPPVAWAIPTIVTLRDGALGFFPVLEAALRRARFDRARTLAECAPGVARPAPRTAPGQDRPGISSAHLAALLGVARRGSAPVGLLLFPRIDPKARGLRLVRLAPGRALRALRGALFRASRPTRSSDLFAPEGARVEVSAGEELARCRRLLAQVPACEAVLGPDAYEAALAPALRARGSVRTSRAGRAPRRGTAGR